MKRIEAVIARAALDDFHRCARELGIFGFDLSVPKARFCERQRSFNGRESKPVTASRIKVDFAVLDEQTKPTIHAVLESVHPESIGVFKLDEDTEASRTHRLWPIQRLLVRRSQQDSEMTSPSLRLKSSHFILNC